MSGENRYFCSACDSYQNASIDHCLKASSHYLIIQIKRFVAIDGVAGKDHRKILCNTNLTIPIQVDDDVTIPREYKLIASINHSGSLTNGHYWAIVKSGDFWLRCNDKAVVLAKQEELNDSFGYILVFEKI